MKFCASWIEFWGAYSSDFEARDRWLEIIVAGYSEPGRFYHTLAHIERLLALYNQYLDRIEDHKVFYLSIVFHDLVYSPKSTTNELDSIVEFGKFKQEFPLTNQESEKIKQNIELTIKHQITADTSEDTKLFLDFDLEILSSSPDDYNEYALQIHQEYHFVQNYKQKRNEVLLSFLSRPKLYFTWFGSTLSGGIARQEAAVKNINMEINQ